MIDLFALALTHGLLALAAWRLVQRVDLDNDQAGQDPAGRDPGTDGEVPARRGRRGTGVRQP